MIQHICDRCGEIIPLYSSSYHHVIFYDKFVKHSNIQYQSNSKYNECDLCDDCLACLHKMNQSFMDMESEGE